MWVDNFLLKSMKLFFTHTLLVFSMCCLFYRYRIFINCVGKKKRKVNKVFRDLYFYVFLMNIFYSVMKNKFIQMRGATNVFVGRVISIRDILRKRNQITNPELTWIKFIKCFIKYLQKHLLIMINIIIRNIRWRTFDENKSVP